MKPRARDLGLNPGSMRVGRSNSIVDVEGVGVGHSTVIEDDSIRTGVTAIVPHQGNTYEERVTAAVDIYNAFGKSTGLLQIMFEGVLETPIMLTETMNTWRVADSVIDYFTERVGTKLRSLNPVVGETNGGFLTDNLDRSVNKIHVFEALDEALSPEGRRTVLEGNVGGGTPMIGYGFKGGIGTSSRTHANFTVGVLVQLNCGRKMDLTISGVPVGRDLEDGSPQPGFGNSIMIIVATDLSLNSRQLWKVAKRGVIGLARTGSFSSNGSGDFTIAFTTGRKGVREMVDMPSLEDSFGEDFLDPVYRATVEATEEAIINALFRAETMRGRGGHLIQELPLDQVMNLLDKYGRIR
jgi:D-aminopeptidase